MKQSKYNTSSICGIFLGAKIKITIFIINAVQTEQQYGQLIASPKNLKTLFVDLERKSLRKEKNTDFEASSTIASFTTTKIKTNLIV
jgi:hypothetical protein